jgi:hypothetical protein
VTSRWAQNGPAGQHQVDAYTVAKQLVAGLDCPLA